MRSHLLLLAILTVAGGRAYPADVDLPGFVANETRTFAGREFFQTFVATWEAYDPKGRFMLSVNERPAARNGSLMTVLYNGAPVYQRFLGFNANIARNAAIDAAGRVYGQVMTADLDSMVGDPDMARDGF